MRESGVVSVGKRPTQGPGGNGGARTPAPSGLEGALSYRQANGNQAFLSHLGRTAAPEPAVMPDRAAPIGPDMPAQEAPVPSAEGEAPAPAPAPILLVEDAAETAGANQMKKTAFLEALRPAVCAAVDQGLAGTDRSSDGCPHVEFWFGHLAGKDASFIERGIQRFAPEARGVGSAADYIPAVAERVRRSTEIWARTGEVQGVPEELAGTVSAGAAAPAVESGGQSGLVMRFKSRSGGARPPDSPAAVRDSLGRGRPLDGGARARMESAYGVAFGDVRIHADTSSAHLADRFNARAFTIGDHVAFGAGEYRPGTVVGDALIAHELAHVVQQRGAADSDAPMRADGGGLQAMEHEADSMAATAVASHWHAGGGVTAVCRKAVSRLRSGLALQRCNRTPSTPSLTFRTRGSINKNDCGGFEWEIGWRVKNATNMTNGVIVQKVEVARDVKDCSNSPIAYNGKGLDPSWYPVWEAWYVNGGAVTPAVGNVNDIYSQNAPGDNTKGSTTVIGTAEYYDGATLPSSFTVTNAAPTWSLPATNSQPTIPGGTGAVDHRLTATWDCCTTDKKTTVTPSTPP
jgi:hypothetical protein